MLTNPKVEESSPVLVQLDVDDNNVARVDANGDAGAIRLVALHTVDMDHPLLPVDLGDLSLTTFVLSPDNPDLVVFADRDGAGLEWQDVHA